MKNGRKYRTLQDRILWNSVIDPEGDCWVWIGPTSGINDYGVIGFWHTARGRSVNTCAHRVAFEAFLGRPVAEGMELHHTCMSRRCVNPSHMEEMPHKENCAPGRRRNGNGKSVT